jgi:cobalt-zinc-cadmium efflux system membrane fusion protein
MSWRIAIVCALLLTLSSSCRRTAKESVAEAESWPVTAWGTTFEIFAEIEPLLAGSLAHSNTHVTVLQGFSPLREGTVALLLTAAGSPPTVFEQRQRKRDGIYVIEVTPPSEGTFDLAFRVVSARGREEIPAGRVRVGSASSAGKLVASPGDAAAQSEMQSISFLKEQQWRTEFGTAWASQGSVRDSVAGSARVRAAAGGEAVLSSPVEAVVASRPWPFVGQGLSRGAAVFALIPTGASDRSLPDLRAEVASITAERGAARNRTQRLEKLLEVEAVSRAEVERARADLAGLDARWNAARRNLETATAARTGRSGAATLSLRAPWSGRVAEVVASPGQSVDPGATLGRIVRDRPVWVEVALRPDDAARLEGTNANGLLLRRAESGNAITIPERDVRIVSRSPEVDPKTSSIMVLLEVDRGVSDLPIGTAAEAELLLAGERRGIVVPVSSLVDDSGVTVVYEQLSGESFARREVRVVQRQGSAALVEGVRAGARVATVGAPAIRRASLLSSGAPEGHVH